MKTSGVETAFTTASIKDPKMSIPCRLVCAIIVLGILLFAGRADARLRQSFEDWEIVERSELIVVGYLKIESIKRVPHKRKPGEGRSWEYHATLAVREVLKGKTREKELPIVIHYGLTPTVKQQSPNASGSSGPMGYVESFMARLLKRKVVEIWDTGNSAMSGTPCLEDATRDNLWFLRRRSGFRGEKSGAGKFGIVDPEDVQPMKLRRYFLACLSETSEKAVERCLKNDPSLGDRAKRFLVHCEIRRICEIDDLDLRAGKLVEIFVRRFNTGRMRAENEIVACGAAAGPHLMRLLKDPAFEKMRPTVARMLCEIRYEPAARHFVEVFNEPGYAASHNVILLFWGRYRYEPCIDILIELLQTNDVFWSKQNLVKGWWNAGGSTPLARERKRRYGEVYYAVVALKEIGDPRAREAIELTKRRWVAVNFENPQIVEECGRALKKFGQKEK